MLKKSPYKIESAVNALFASASKKIAKDAEDEGEHEEHNDGNPAAQFDAADGKGRGVQSNDSLEDLVYKQTYELSNGISFPRAQKEPL